METYEGCEWKNKRMDKSKDDLSEGAKKLRKSAKKTSKSIRKLEKDTDADGLEDIVQGMLRTDGINMSQGSKYERGETKNNKGDTFCSQKYVEYYQRGHETDESDWIKN